MASIENIVANGLDPAAAAELGGGDTFWATSALSDARVFAQANPALGPPAVLGVELSPATVSSLVRQGLLEINGHVYQFTGDGWEFVNHFGHFFRVE